MNNSIENRRKLMEENEAKLEGRVSERIKLLIARQYLWGEYTKPLEELTDQELLAVAYVGPKTVAEIRKVIPAP